MFIPGAPTGPNQRPGTTRERIALVRREREKAELCTKDAANRQRVTPFTGAAWIRFEVRRYRLLDDDNLVVSLKHFRDGVYRAILPLGDGPGTAYRWEPPLQIQVANKRMEGVYVMIEEPEPGDAPTRPFSGTPA